MFLNSDVSSTETIHNYYCRKTSHVKREAVDARNDYNSRTLLTDVSYLFQDLSKLEEEEMDETQEYGSSSSSRSCDVDTSLTSPGTRSRYIDIYIVDIWCNNAHGVARYT